MLKCPKCLSSEIEPNADFLTGVYSCRKCGYSGTLIIEEDIDEKNKRLIYNLKSKNKI